MTDAFYKLGFIRPHESVSVRSLECLSKNRIAKRLRSLRVVDSPAVERALHTARLDLLDRVRCGERQLRGPGCLGAFDYGPNLVGLDEGADRVVNGDDSGALFFHDLKPAID